MADPYVSSIILPFIFTPKFVVFAVIAAIVYHYYKIYSHLSNIPSPPYNVLLGHAPDFADYTQIIERMREHNLKYGGIIRILVGPVKPSLLVTDPKMIDFILTSSKVVKSRYSIEFLSSWLGQGLLLSSGQLWRSRRKAVTSSFSQTSTLKKYIDYFEHNGDKLIEILKDEAHKDLTDVYVLMKRFALDVICESAMKVSVNALQENANSFQRSIETLNQVFASRVVSVFKRCPLFYKYTEAYQKEMQAVATMDSFVKNIIDKKMENRENVKEVEAFIDILVQSKVGGEYLFDHAGIREEVNTFIFAGHETTAHAMSFILYVLSQQHEAQAKILEEQKHIFGEQQNPVVTYDDLNRMTYLEQVIKECLRLYPPVPFIARKMTEDIRYGDMILPKDLNIVINIYGCHRDPLNFPNPDEFIPERFETKKNIPPNSFLPFGGGLRICLGKRFAMLELASCVSKIVRNFEIMSPNPPIQLKLFPSITMGSMNGVHVRLRRRHII